MDSGSRSNTVERRKAILKIIGENGQVMVHELSRHFNVSEVTIRNDLDQLEKKKALIRARGGAMKMEGNVSIDHRISEKDKLHFNEKLRIGKCAAKLIKDNDTIIVDSGTTTVEIIKNLPDVKDLTIITNALNIVNQLLSHPEINVVIPGGYLRKNSLSLVGPLAEKNFRNFYVDKVFVGVDGFDTKMGIYTPNMEEAHLNEIMIDVAKEVILVCDSSKFQRRSLAYICNLDKIDKVITDAGIPDEDKRRLEDAGITVIIA